MKTDAVRRAGSFSAHGGRVASTEGEGLEGVVASANSAGLAHARRRLAARLPAAAIAGARQYFPEAKVDSWDGGERPDIAADELFADICSSPRSVAVGEKADGLQLELRTLGQALTISELGDQVEPGSNIALLSPERLRHAAMKNASIELRQFDRQCPSWALFADDVAAVSGADVFLKLFVADGHRSVNGWHRDRSDVLVTVVHGAKGFAVADVDAGDTQGEERTVVDAILRPGDALVLPRARLHCATPAGELSALLSIGLMRSGDWPYRQVPPTHLGFREYPRSTTAYRLCLRSHLPATPSRAEGPHVATVRTRLPGGIALLAAGGAAVTFVAAGMVYEASEAVVRALACIHATDGTSSVDVAAAVGLSADRSLAILAALVSEGLVSRMIT